MAIYKKGLHDSICQQKNPAEKERYKSLKDKSNFIEVSHIHNIGGICIYGFDDKATDSVAIFLKTIADNTGNGFFNYLLRTNGTRHASLKI